MLTLEIWVGAFTFLKQEARSKKKKQALTLTIGNGLSLTIDFDDDVPKTVEHHHLTIHFNLQ